MAMSGYTEVISKVKPVNGGDFKVVDWKDVDWSGFELPDGVEARGDRLHVRYSPVAEPDEMWLAGDRSKKPNTFIGICVDTEDEAPTDPKRYEWTRFKGAGIRVGSGRPNLGAALGDLYIDGETGEIYEFVSHQ